MENLQRIYDKIWQKKVPQILFYLALTIELGMVIIDKSNYINPIEGTLFRVTFVLFALKLFSTEYTWKEWALIVFFEVIGIISYKVTGKNDVIRIVTFVAACKGIPLKQMIRYAFYVTLIGCAAIVLLSVTGIYGEMTLTAYYGRGANRQAMYEDLSRLGIEETRYTLGMGHPNSLSCMYLMLCAMGIYVFSEKMKWYSYFFLMLLNIGVYSLTNSKTSMLITTCLLLGGFIMTYCRFLKNHWIAYIGAFLVFVCCIGFSVDAAAYAQKVQQAKWNETYLGDSYADNHTILLLRIDEQLNGRIISLANSENDDGAMETWSVFSCPNNMNYYFDMGWVKLFYRYGVIPGILYCAACLALLWQFYKKKDAFGLVMFTVMTIYTVMEAHLFSIYIGRNFMLMMMGAYFLQDKTCIEKNRREYMKKRLGQYVISLVLPILLLLVIYMIWGQYPFGNKTLLIWDMDEQYAPFFAHLHNILHGDASALYTFSRALGGNMVSVAAYYLFSPFNLVFYFFDAENIYIGILIVTLLKTGECGLAMYWFLNQRRQDRFSIIFSTAYALSAYMIGYQFNIFWIDALILLPLVCNAVERLADGQKYLFYTITIALSVITNFYTGYMICIFSVLYFVCYFVFISDKKLNKKDLFKTVLVYIASSFLGGMLSMCVSLPTLDIMSGGKAGLSLSVLKNFKNMFKYSELFDAAFCGTISNKQINSGKPLIYCGVFAVIMALYWLIRAKVSIRKKIGYILPLFVIVVSFHHYNLNCVWHAFNPPLGSPYRYSFIYIFIVLYTAYMGYIELMDTGMINKNDKYVIFGIGLVLGLGLLCRIENFMENQKVNIMLLNIFLTVTYIGLVFIVKNKAVRRLVILFFTCVELVINAECLYMVSSQYDSVKVDEYQDYMQKMLPLVEESKRGAEENGGIVRTAIERSARRTANDPFLFSLYGLDSYTSVEKQNVISIAGNFGYSNNIVWGMHYNNGVTKAGDAFLGVKYLISGINPDSGYNILKESGDIALYESENTLPFAFLMDSAIMEDKSLENPFQYMNELYGNLDTLQDEEIFKKLNGKLLNSVNCNVLEDGGWVVDMPVYGSESDGAVNGSAYLEYEFETDLEMAVYTRYDRAGVSNAEVYMDDKIVELSGQTSDIKKLGTLPAGCKFRLRCYLPEDGIISPDKIYVYGESADVLESYVIEVNNQPVNIRMHNEAYIEISCTNEDTETKYLLCTIPYDKGWRVKINGKRVEAEEIQHFVALPVENGKYEIELRFVPRGLYAGIIMTFVSILILVIMSMSHRMKHVNFFSG